MPAIRVETGPFAGQAFVIGPERITIGRDERATIRIEDAGVSREHAEIFRLGEMCFVKDLGSRNGTWVRGRPAAEDLLQDGDRIQVGTTILVFETGSFERPRFVERLRAVVAGLDRLASGGLAIEEALDRLGAEGSDPVLVEAIRKAYQEEP